MKTWDLLLLIRPSKLRCANLMAAASLYSLVISYDVKCVLVDMPRGFEVFLHQFEGADDALREAAKLGLLYCPQSIARAYEPLISCLIKLVRNGVKAVCYLDPDTVKSNHDLAIRASRLVLRASIKKLSDEDLEEWLQLLGEYGLQYLKLFNNMISHLTMVKARKAIILMGLEGFECARLLRREGLRVKVKTAGLPYLRSPLEIMCKKYLQGKLTIDELKRLINEYVDYIKNYVLKYESLDEAHKAWSEKKAPWLRSFASKIGMIDVFCKS